MENNKMSYEELVKLLEEKNAKLGELEVRANMFEEWAVHYKSENMKLNNYLNQYANELERAGQIIKELSEHTHHHHHEEEVIEGEIAEE